MPPLSSVPLDATRIAAADAIVIVTDHSACDYELVLKHASLIIDTRGVYRMPHWKVVKA
jgi:UDP-N-acetyl-D-glucosamine dehydrogenase